MNRQISNGGMTRHS